MSNKRKLLLSWIGLDSDFVQPSLLGKPPGGTVNPSLDGPNITMHRHFEDRGYQKHVILYTEDTKSQMRMQRLRDFFKEDNETWPVEFRLVRMPDPDVINIQVLQQKMTVLLTELKDYVIDILVTTGTKTMHTVWHLIHLAYKERTQLIQVRPSIHSDDRQPELVTISFDQSDLPRRAVVIEGLITRPTADADLVIGDTIKPAYDLAAKIALADRVPALILGRSGTGKQTLARYLHAHSARKGMPFQVVRCVSLSDELLWATLFGQAKGALQGHGAERRGVLEQCKGGTVLLAEIGDLSPAIQEALLRVIDAQEVVPLGSSEVRKVDVRVVATTHRHLPEACEAGRFRWDLYYRLAVVELRLPTLAEWTRADREQLWDRLVERKQAELQLPAALKVTPEVKKRILQYPFPGNILEFENLVARLHAVAEERVLLHDLPGSLTYAPEDQPWRLDKVEQAHLAKALHFQGYNLTATAELLGIAVNTLKEKCKRFGLPLKQAQ